MLKFNSSLKALGAATLLGLGSIAVSAPASAQSLQDVLAKVRQDSRLILQLNPRRWRTPVALLRLQNLAAAL